VDFTCSSMLSTDSSWCLGVDHTSWNQSNTGWIYCFVACFMEFVRKCFELLTSLRIWCSGYHIRSHAVTSSLVRRRSWRGLDIELERVTGFKGLNWGWDFLANTPWILFASDVLAVMPIFLFHRTFIEIPSDAFVKNPLHSYVECPILILLEPYKAAKTLKVHTRQQRDGV